LLQIRKLKLDSLYHVAGKTGLNSLRMHVYDLCPEVYSYFMMPITISKCTRYLSRNAHASEHSVNCL